ncbi:hypothetical protein [Devosia nitrariae]|uniref:Uncharacterized protein n=1 Tax=Devosia nitrariae TaxID=2071872 RepID=A0ABQ5W769_9HYPH|nr:hypothetical protein [Devosia nitrariae]GLQ55598.1 hypothetical protein GCM10010862_28570 [Devosia nitrariae]
MITGTTKIAYFAEARTSCRSVSATTPTLSTMSARSARCPPTLDISYAWERIEATTVQLVTIA